MFSPDWNASSPTASSSVGPPSKKETTWNDKCLYICVADYCGKKCKVEYIAHSINLKDMLYSDDLSDRVLNSNTVFKVSDDPPACAGFGIGLGRTTIFLAGGFRAIYHKEMVVPNPSPQIRAYQISDTDFQGGVAPFSHGKVRPLIWEFEGYLFALARNPPPPPCMDAPYSEWNRCFEMYVRETDQWILLPDPPSYAYPADGAVDVCVDGVDGADGGDGGNGGNGGNGGDGGYVDDGESDPNLVYRSRHYYSRFSFAILGSQLFVSNPLHPDYTYKCNLSNLKNKLPVEWQVSPFHFEGTTLGVKTDEGHVVVFSHDVFVPFLPEYAVVNDEDNSYFNITVDVLLSGSDEDRVPRQSLLMPQGLHGVVDSQFVHLGGQKVTFLSSTRKDLKLFVTAITFDFQLERTNDGFKIKPKFHPTRLWQFQNKEGSNGIAQMVDAVVVDEIMK